MKHKIHYSCVTQTTVFCLFFRPIIHCCRCIKTASVNVTTQLNFHKMKTNKTILVILVTS